MQNTNLNFLLRFAAISGNVLFILWVTYNGINEGFRGTVPQKMSYAGLMCLLLLNCYLILAKSKPKQIIEQ